MLYHHDSRNYEAAASDAADRARDRLNGLIDEGRKNATHVLDKVFTEVPTDMVCKAKALEFFKGPDYDKEEEGAVVTVPGDLKVGIPGQGEFDLHRHALSQVCERAGIPAKYRNTLSDGDTWQRELLAHNLRELYSHSTKRHLVRAVDDEVRGVLSDKFRRIDSRPIIEAFAGCLHEMGAVPVEGYYMQTKIALKGMIPVVYEPVPNEVMAFGLVLQNSDYGHGPLSIRAFVLRLWCTNYAITDECLRQVHLGRRLDENMVYSKRTYELDTEASVSAVKDIVSQAISEERRAMYLDGIKAAHEQKVSPTEIKAFLKKHLSTKAEQDKVIDAFNSPDVEMMPAGQTMWRLSNAISWVAGQEEDNVKKLELQQAAGAFFAHPVAA